ALAIVSARDPDAVVVARRGPPLLLGIGDGENFAASDVSALLPVTRRVVYLEDGDCAEIRPAGYRVVDARGQAVERGVHLSELTDEAVALGPYRHYMQKEIHEQPGALANTLEVVTGASSLQPGLFGAEAEQLLRGASSVHLIACGTSYHAALIGRYWLEDIAGIPTRSEIASEYRYRRSVPDPKGLFVTISQSGETADTLAALEHAKSLGYAATLSICNVPESSLVRASRLRYMTRAGPEIGVASTKAFTTQLAALFLLSLVVARIRGRLDADAERAHLNALRQLVYETRPAVAGAPSDALIEKLKSNLQEVRARGGELYIFADEGAHIPSSDAVHVIELGAHAGALSPILHVVPLQLLAYHTA